MSTQFAPDEVFSRVSMLLGPETTGRLGRSKVAILGLGAVGFAAAESLARTGIKNFLLADFDILRSSNINRHLLASAESIGRSKAGEAKARITGINPEARVLTSGLFIHGDTVDSIVPPDTDLVIDAIDSVGPKTAALASLAAKGFRIVSCMGAAARTDPFSLRVGDISTTSVCPLALLVRKKLRKAGISSGITCVYSVQKPLPAVSAPDVGPEPEIFERGRKRRPLGSVFYMTAAAGLLASYAGLLLLAGDSWPGNAGNP